jgi:CheY-like chemotaxis protein/HPt (histidine-containing phosphotransfer) domain-containing protein
VLVVEDNTINQQVAEEILGGFGLLVEIAANGRIATDMLRSSADRYDVVLMDLQMPEMDGYEATRTIRTLLKNQTTPIIAMSAHALQHERQRALDVGMNDYVTKPVDPERLLATLARWITPRDGRPAVVAPVGDRATGLPDDLPESLPGIHVSSALARVMGNRALFRTLLGDFLERHASVVAEIRTALERDDAVVARRLAHTIQGVAGNLSMTEVCACARTTETRILEADRARMPEALESLDRAIRAVKPSVEHLLKAGPVPAQPAVVAETSPLDAARVGSLVVELDRSLRRNSLTARKQCGELAKALAGGAGDLSATVEQLEACLTRLDFRQARTLLAGVAARLDVALQ